MATMKEIRTLGTLRVARRDGGQAADPEFSLRGTALSYNVLSQDLGGFREQIAPGAFADHLRTSPDVRCLFNHSADHVLGRTKNGTLTLEDTPSGLNFRCKLDPNQQAHRDLYSSVQRGDISSCSFAFGVDGDDGDTFDEPKGEDGQRYFRRTVRKAKLFDVSPVTNPAYAGDATAIAARSHGRIVIPSSAATRAAEDAWLRRQADIVGEKIRVEAILDPAMRAVVFRGGKFYRDYAKEAELARAAERRYDDDDLSDDDPDEWDWEDDDSEKKHRKSAEKHRMLAHRATDCFAATPHFRAADLHDVAASKRSFSATTAAQAASRALRK